MAKYGTFRRQFGQETTDAFTVETSNWTIKVYIYVGDMYDENLLHRVRYVNLNIVIWYFKLWNGLPEPLGFYS